MKRALSMVALGLGLAAISSRPAFAMPPETLLAHIPFAFSVHDENMPPGDYRIQPLGDLDRDLLEVRSVDGRHTAIVFSEDAPAEPRTGRPKLVFDRYGQMKFLHAIEIPSETGATFEPTRSEVQAARSFASEHAAHASVGRVGR
jgi:hypothetical protein